MEEVVVVRSLLDQTGTRGGRGREVWRVREEGVCGGEGGRACVEGEGGRASSAIPASVRVPSHF